MESNSTNPDARPPEPATPGDALPPTTADPELGAMPATGEAMVAPPPPPEPWETRVLVSAFWGPQGVRAGWSIAAWIVLIFVFSAGVGALFLKLHLITQGKHTETASSTLWGELVLLLPLIGASAVVALIERRKGNLMAYNLRGPSRVLYFLSGLVAGFVALSVLVGGLRAGHWLNFGPVALSGSEILRYAFLWFLAFLAVGFTEEGMFRCYLLSTFTRGLNFWSAFGILVVVCGALAIFGKGNGVWGVYIMAGLGLVPCLLLHLKKSPHSAFWLATWVTSTLFGAVHTGNAGENWIGIFAAAAIGFVFCVSIYVTGSAWWAIGCHAAWDWAETYFYGTADSGMVAPGHLLTASPAGNPLWSGGADGPEGSVLVLAVILLLLIGLIAMFGRRSRMPVQDAG